MNDNDEETGEEIGEETDEGTPRDEPRASNAKPEDAGFFERAFDAGTTEGHSNEEPATPLEVAEFEVPYELCGKYLKGLKQDFVVQLRSLTPKMEATISKTAESGPQMSMAFAQASVCAVNGAPLKRHQKEWLWSHLGTAGRQLVIGMYGEAFMARPKALRKSKVSRR